ncbi:MAG: hypothetical protein AAGA90_14620 [Actinomycetota bacterium]
MDESTPIEPDDGDATNIADAGMDDLPDGLATAAPTGTGADAGGGLARRGLVVFAVFAVVVAGAIAFALAGGDGDGGDAATESESDADDNDGVEADTEGADSDTEGSGDTDEADGAEGDEAVSADEDDAADAGGYSVVATADDSAYYGGEAPLAWGDGFLSIRQEFVPSEVTLPELVPDLAERVPAEVAEAVEAAGIDLNEPGSINDAITALSEAGLFDEVSEIFLEDPVLMEAYGTVSGGTYVQIAEYSADGITWEPVDFDFKLSENAWPEYRSNGDHLIAVVTDNTWGPDGRRLDLSISIHLTSDLVSWTTVDLPITLPTAPDYVQQDAWIDQVAITADGWYVGASVNQYIDLYQVLPERIRTGNYSWNAVAEGVRIEDWAALHEAEMAAAESGEWEDVEALEPVLVEVISWDELPLTFEEWNTTTFDSGGRQAFVGTFDGSITPAASPEGIEWFQVAGTGQGYLAWGQIYTPSELTMQELVPDIESRFPAEILDAFADAGLSVGDADSIDAASALLEEAGLLDLATETVMNDPELLDAFMQVTSGGVYDTAAFFSADGLSWAPVTVPELEWVESIVPIGDAVLVIGSSENGQRFWLGDPETGSWEQVDGPDLGENQWLYFDARSSSGEGLAAVIDSGESYGPDFVAWSATIEHDGFELTMSADGEGFQTLTIVEIATGEVVRDTTIEMWSEELYLWGEDDTFEFLDADGNVVVTVPMELGEELAWRAESEAYDAWYQANPYEPELTLVATVDGRNWIVQPLDVSPTDEGWYGGGAAAINGGVAVYRDPTGWHRVVVG